MFQRLPLIAAVVVALICAAEALRRVVTPITTHTTPHLSGVTMALVGLIAVTLVLSWTRRTAFGSRAHRVTRWGVLVAASVTLWIVIEALFGESPADRVPHTLLALGGVGLATLLTFPDGTRWRQVAITSALVGGAIPWVALFGHAMSVLPFYAMPDSPSIGMSVPAALALITLAIGVMGIWPDHGFVALLGSSSEGGLLLRWLLPAALLFPIGMGSLMAMLTRAGVITETLSVAVNLGVTSVIFVGLVLLVGLLLKRRDAERREATAEREALLARLQASLSELEQLQSNFVTVCAWTRRVLDQGKWVKFEEFLDKRLHIATSHGISDDAASEELSALLDADHDIDTDLAQSTDSPAPDQPNNG